MYFDLIKKFSNVLDQQAPLKNKYIRGNNAQFMNKELGKVIMKRSNGVIQKVCHRKNPDF